MRSGRNSLQPLKYQLGKHGIPCFCISAYYSLTVSRAMTLGLVDVYICKFFLERLIVRNFLLIHINFYYPDGRHLYPPRLPIVYRAQIRFVSVTESDNRLWNIYALSNPFPGDFLFKTRC